MFTCVLMHVNLILTWSMMLFDTGSLEMCWDVLGNKKISHFVHVKKEIDETLSNREKISIIETAIHTVLFNSSS